MRCLKKLTQKSPHFISFPLWIIRATSCTLRGNRESRTVVDSFVQQVARYEGIVNHVSGLNHSCNKLHATRESVNRVSGLNLSCIEMHATGKSWIAHRGWIVRASRCTLRGNRWITYRGDYSCNKLHATRESWIAYRGWIIRATSCTLRGVKDARYGHCIKRYRYE